MHLHSHLRSAEEIISLYDGITPFASWLKSYFREHKKFGSKDRRLVADLCFCFYRLGKGWTSKTIEDRLLIGQFLCHRESPFIKDFKPEWNSHTGGSILEKVDVVGHGDGNLIFPFQEELSGGIEAVSFTQSHLIQPDLFLRIRPGKKENVIASLEGAGIHYTLEDDCLRLANMTRVDDVLSMDRDVVVQDKSSQQVLHHLLPNAHVLPPAFTAWDCCAASGGKSILLHDQFPKARLTVSDVRQSILHNLKSRFGRAGIANYQWFVTDVSASQFKPAKKFDLVICDAPCSGSGTWSRTPEQLWFFKNEKIKVYADLQKRIAVNAVKGLKKGGLFLYITCSVFRKENEEVVDKIMVNTELKLLNQQYFKGYTQRADTLFAALFSL